jgi:hypothetical protein
MGEFYKMLTKDQELEEGVIVNPLDSYETIISAVNHELEDSDEIGILIATEQEEMLKECSGENPVAEEMPVMYPILIATFPSFCLFELGDDTYRVSYTYDNRTRRVKLGTPEEVTLDISIAATPPEED